MTSFCKMGFVFSSGTGENRCTVGGGEGRGMDSSPVCLKPLGFLLLPSQGLLPALGLQGIITAREVIWKKKIQPL